MNTASIPSLAVIGLGLGIVFFGLICLIIICSIMGAICKRFIKEKPQQAEPANNEIANKQELIAACCAVIAEEIGTEAKNIKVVSFKRA